MIFNRTVLLLIVTFSLFGYAQLEKNKKDKNGCGINQKLKECHEKSNNCPKTCECKQGFVQVEGTDDCEPAPVRCKFDLVVDLVFIVDGSEFISENSFNDLRFFLVEILTKVYGSDNNVRVGIVVYGPHDPTVILLDKTKKLCDVLKILTDIKYIPHGVGTTLVDAIKIAGDFVLSQCNGARFGSLKHIFVLGELADLHTAKDKLLDVFDSQHQKGHRLSFITIKNEGPIPQSYFHLNVQSSKDLSSHLAKVFEITCQCDTCPKGYQKVGYNCLDINECDSSSCHENSICINTLGSFVCYCSDDLTYRGHEAGCGKEKEKEKEKEKVVEKVTTCPPTKPIVKPTPCPPAKEKPCKPTDKVITVCDAVTCKSPGKCTNSDGMNFCICPRGFRYDVKDGCVDVDECLSNPCLRNGICKNTKGSFECSCKHGFEYNVDFGCVDIDECLDKQSCNGNGICKNTLGSYLCTCNSGYEYSTDKGCIDIDECTVYNDSCHGENVTCVNTPGSFKCDCLHGFEYKLQTCTDINECLLAGNCPAGSVCTNSIGSYNCACNKGFIFNEEKKSCDLDKSLNVVQPKADLLFVVDTSDAMGSNLPIVTEMIMNIIKDYQSKSATLIKRYFAIQTGGKGDVKVLYKEETDKNVLDSTKLINSIGGDSVFSVGLKSARELYTKYGQVNSSKIIISITATKPSTFSKDEIAAIKEEVELIKHQGRLVIIYIGESVKSSEWTVVFQPEEIEQYVIAADATFITTIYKLVYETTDRLIKCPEGFFFLDKVCQFKTASAVYCKWDDKLYALNSKWNSSCAVYNCTEQGVVLLERSCMGYDGDCYKGDDFFPCTVDGKLHWRCMCSISQPVDKETQKVSQIMKYVIVTFDKEASIKAVKLADATGKCELPFKFNGKWYYACTDARSTSRWCSHTTFYEKRYSYCDQQIVSQCIYDGKTYFEGNSWKVKCNSLTCTAGQARIKIRCAALNGTCIDINTGSYPCQVGNNKFSSCMCVPDNNGYGENIGEEKQVIDDGGQISGSLVEFCVDKITGDKFEVGKTWVKNCFTLRCAKSGMTQVLDKQCESQTGKCFVAGKDESFDCNMNGVDKKDCKCIKENDEVVLVWSQGKKIEKKTVETTKILAIFKV